MRSPLANLERSLRPFFKNKFGRASLGTLVLALILTLVFPKEGQDIAKQILGDPSTKTSKTQQLASMDTEDLLGRWTVSQVSDGDTIRVQRDGRELKLRLIGINTPEIAHRQGEVSQPYGEEAKRYTDKLLKGKSVYLTFDREPQDKYQRYLAYVWLEDPSGRERDEAFVRKQQANALLLQKGLAKAYRVAPNTSYADLFRQLEKESQQRRQGMWK